MLSIQKRYRTFADTPLHEVSDGRRTRMNDGNAYHRIHRPELFVYSRGFREVARSYQGNLIESQSKRYNKKVGVTHRALRARRRDTVSRL